MNLLKTLTRSSSWVKCGLSIAAAATVGVLGSGIAPAGAQPPPPPGAPPKPAEVWNGQPVVWNPAWGGRWGVWINGGWISLTSNPVTGGG